MKKAALIIAIPLLLACSAFAGGTNYYDGTEVQPSYYSQGGWFSAMIGSMLGAAAGRYVADLF
jgi:hypothetical protein